MVRKAVAALFIVPTAVIGSLAPASADNAVLYARLTGAGERPGPGDADAVGQARITIDDATNTLCVSFGWVNVDGTLSGFHIHLGPPAAAGPIVVPFAVPVGKVQTYQCVGVPNEALLDNIAANPDQYYINLHSQPSFGPGAIRGQLIRAG